MRGENDLGDSVTLATSTAHKYNCTRSGQICIRELEHCISIFRWHVYDLVACVGFGPI
jgi:hypothetical protein